MRFRLAPRCIAFEVKKKGIIDNRFFEARNGYVKILLHMPSTTKTSVFLDRMPMHPAGTSPIWD